MKEEACVVKSVLMMAVILVILTGAISCGKPGSALNWYPKAERVGGKITSTVDHEIIIDKFDFNDTAQIQGGDKGSIRRWWVAVECDYWASCFMRCDGSIKQCRKLAEDSNLKVISVSPF